MATATFNSLRGKNQKTALIAVKKSAFEFSSTFAYVPASAVAQAVGKPVEELEKGDAFTIHGEFEYVPIIDVETGEVRSYENGEPLLTLRFK